MLIGIGCDACQCRSIMLADVALGALKRCASSCIVAAPHLGQRPKNCCRVSSGLARVAVLVEMFNGHYRGFS
jgi:hypothetical protein